MVGHKGSYVYLFCGTLTSIGALQIAPIKCSCYSLSAYDFLLADACVDKLT
jgi:hypothetical protein